MLTEAQRALRRSGVGASECAAAVGLSPWMTPYELFLLKTGGAEPPAETLPMRFGSAVEPFILSEFQRLHPEEVFVAAPDTLRRGRLLAHLDAWVPGRFNVQAKTARSREGWGEPGTSDIPLHYLLQVQHEMLVAEVPLTFVPVLFGGAEYEEFVVEADAELQQLIEEGVNAFWRHVERGEPPEPQGLPDVLARWGRRSSSGCVVADAPVLAAVQALQRLKAERERIEAHEAECKAVVLQALAEADTLLDAGGRVLATWKAPRPAQRLDVAAFRATFPKLHQQLLRPDEPTRRFVLK